LSDLVKIEPTAKSFLTLEDENPNQIFLFIFSYDPYLMSDVL